AVAEELPGVADLRNHIEIEVSDHDFVFVAASLGDDLAAGRTEITLSVKFADVPRRFPAHAIDGADKISVGHSMRRLLPLPQVLGKPGHGRRRIEDNLRSIHAQHAGAFREVAVVTDINADARVFGLKGGITGIAGGEIKLLPKARGHLRDVMLAILSQILS